ncbi:hypothetical protein [Streptomyces sp. Wb2n-11]|uniref:DUF7144 family membrane protein n=1 Tax=Streptomyces sp. Wb2n-11 TaxID=1030533 RepID=UPI000AF51339|nr:hypothetical protein [Streptomyces sp. Wb2n-11]
MRQADEDRGGSGACARGGTVFAGVLLLVDGVLTVLNGIAGIAEDNIYERIGDYVYKFGLTTWGWIHLVIGAVLILTGLGILKGGAAARGLGIGMAAPSVVADFLWLPYQPVWAIIAIALGVFVIWALATDRSVA